MSRTTRPETAPDGSWIYDHDHKPASQPPPWIDDAGRTVTETPAGTVRTMPDFSATPARCAHSPAITCAACPPRQAGRHRSPVIACWGYRCGVPLYQVTGQAGGTRYVNATDHEPHTCARYPLGGDAPARAPYAGRHAGQATR